MDNIFFLLILLIIIIILYFYFQNYVIFKTVKSRIDNNNYTVLNTNNYQEAADYLGMLNRDIIKLIKYIEINYKAYNIPEKNVLNLKNRYSYKYLSEAMLSENYTSYTIAKTWISLCIRHKPQYLNFVEYNTALYVLIHELSHMICDSYVSEKEHYTNKEYYNIFKGLLDASYSIGILKYTNYSKTPVEYCGIKIK